MERQEGKENEKKGGGDRKAEIRGGKGEERTKRRSNRIRRSNRKAGLPEGRGDKKERCAENQGQPRLKSLDLVTHLKELAGF